MRALWKRVPGERVREEVMCVMELQAHRDLVAGEQWEASSAILQAEGGRAQARATSRRSARGETFDLQGACALRPLQIWHSLAPSGLRNVLEPIGCRKPTAAQADWGPTHGFGVRLPTAQAGLASCRSGYRSIQFRTPTAREAGRLVRCGEAGVQKIESVGDETLGRGGDGVASPDLDR